MRLHLRNLAVCAATVIVVVTATSTPAYATTALAPNTFLLATAPETYTFSTTLAYWSAIAVRPGPGLDQDLQLRDSVGNILANSTWGTGATDVIVINSTAGARPLGGYRATATKYSGSGTYSVMFREIRAVFPVPTNPIGNTDTALPIRFDAPVAAYMIYLAAGQGFRIHTGSATAVYLAGSTAGVPSTYVRTRSQLQNAYVVADNVPSADGYGYCRVFVAPTAGWYSAILVWTTPWAPPPFNGGHAVFPQRYNPALGDTLTQCPAPQIP